MHAAHRAAHLMHARHWLVGRSGVALRLRRHPEQYRRRGARAVDLPVGGCPPAPPTGEPKQKVVLS